MENALVDTTKLDTVTPFPGINDRLYTSVVQYTGRQEQPYHAPSRK